MSRKLTLILFLSGLVAVMAASAFGAAPVLKARNPVAGKYVVILKDDLVGRDAVVTTANDLTLRHRGRLITVFTHGVRGFGIELPAAAIAGLANDPRVAWIEEDQVGHPSYSVEYYSDDSHWHLDRIDQWTPIPQMGTKAYAWTSTGSGVDAYVVDTGIQSQHTEFSNGNVTAGANYAGSDGFAPTNPCGGFGNYFGGGHGTAVASAIGGRTVGVARGVTLVPVKVFSCNPNSIYELTTDVLGTLYGLDWILAQVQSNPSRRAVVNMSLYFEGLERDPACGGPSWDCRPALENNVRDLVNANVVVVASANNQNGNFCDGQTPARMGYGGIYDPNDMYPDWPFVITVGGADINDARYFCASCPAGEQGSNYGPCVDIYAPGKNMRLAHVASSTAYRDDTYWISLYNSQHPGVNYTQEWVTSGTSFAAPIVTGVVARLLQTFPSMSVRQVWNFLHDNSTTYPAVPHNFDSPDTKLDNDRLVYISPNN